MATNVGHAECASEMAVRRLLIIVNVDWFFLSHRVAIARAARAHGYEVHVACTDTGRFPELHKLGFFTHPIPDIRTTSGVLGHFSLAKKMYQTVKRIAPDVVHLVTIKPVLIGGMVTRLTKTPVVVAAISGMGSKPFEIDSRSGDEDCPT
jgi:UDP:flavonoid glycosyltransferase YjiC (YdhE family)